MNNDPLVTYLNDHLAGSTAAVELLEHMIERQEGSPRRQFFADLRAEIEDDRSVLRRLIRDVGGKERRGRSAAAWLVEKLAELKLHVDAPSDLLHELEALETLALGIEGKHGLWRALEVAGNRVPEAQLLDLGDLRRRAKDQFARVEGLRLELAPQALSAAAVEGRTAQPAS